MSQCMKIFRPRRSWAAAATPIAVEAVRRKFRRDSLDKDMFATGHKYYTPDVPYAT